MPEYLPFQVWPTRKGFASVKVPVVTMSPALTETSDGSAEIPSNRCFSAEMGPSRTLPPLPSSTTLLSQHKITF